jgi:hypothetical protein
MVQVVSRLSIYDGNAEALRQSNWIDARILGAGAAETFQAPATAKYVLFSANGDFYARIDPAGVAAFVPAGDIVDGSAAELNPAMRQLPSDQAYISLIAAVATTVTMQFFA